MKVTLELHDKPTSQTYTSLDVITGSVYLKVRESISIACISVALQGKHWQRPILLEKIQFQPSYRNTTAVCTQHGRS